MDFAIGFVIGLVTGIVNLLLIVGYWKDKALIESGIASDQMNRANYWQSKYESEMQTQTEDEDEDEINGG